MPPTPSSETELISDYCSGPGPGQGPGWYGRPRDGPSGEAPGAEGAVRISYNSGRIATETGSRILEPPLLTTVPGVTAATARVNTEMSRRWGALVLGFATATGRAVSTIDIPLGQLRCSRLLAIARCKLWWMTPAWGFQGKDVPPETQFLLLEAEQGGPYVILLPLIDSNSFRATLRPGGDMPGTDSDSVTIRIESGDEGNTSASWAASLLVAASSDPYTLIDEAVAAAASMSGGGQPLSAKQPPPSLDCFGWCTWDAFYSKVAARDLSAGLEALANGGAPPRLLILDDGWQTTELDKELQAHEPTLLDNAQVLQTQHSFLHHEAEELAAHAGGTSAAIATMPLLEEDEAPPMSLGSYQEASCSRWFWLFTEILSKIVGWITGFGEWLFIKFYENVVEPATWNGYIVRGFKWCATKGPLKGPLLGFFATSGTFLRRLASVRANHKFATVHSGPNELTNLQSNLCDVISDVRSRHGVRFFYCWHGLSGYWGGVSMEAKDVAHMPTDLVFANPTPGVLEVEPAMNWGPASLAGVGLVRDPRLLYEELHSYLAGCGVTGVKVDCQAGVGLVPGPGGGPISAHRAHTALEASVAKHFPGNHLINCMGHSTENFYRYASSAVARCCDDFYPSDPASHTSHIGNAAYNSLFLGALVQPDWDMFHSKHPAGELHAVARSVSGSGVYVSDKPGQHDFALLRRLVLPDGAVLRGLLPGRPTRDTLFEDPMCDGRTLLKVWNRNGAGGVVGVFNIQGASWDRRRRKFWIHDKSPPSLSAFVCPNDIWDMQTSAVGAQFVMWRSVTEKLEVVVGGSGRVCVQLPARGSETVTVVPVTEASGGVKFAPIGLRELFNPGAAVVSCLLEDPSGPAHFHLVIRGMGSLCCYSSVAPKECRLDGFDVPFTHDKSRLLLTVEIPTHTSSANSDAADGCGERYLFLDVVF